MCPRFFAALALGGLGLVGVAAGVRADEAAWSELEAARTRLAEASPLVADFVQSYIPAGFSSGDEEGGRLYLSLPACLRWDYEEPYPRSYLLCGQTVWSWSPGDPIGDRYLSVSREEAGLDFLLLSVERLRQRYAATSTTGPSGATRIDFTSLSDEAPFARATIVLDGESRQPVRLEYADREGNETRFELTHHRDLTESGLFLPPEEIEWVDG